MSTKQRSQSKSTGAPFASTGTAACAATSIPGAFPPHTPRAEDRMLAAMEYAAYQLGEINQRLARIVDVTEEVRRRVRG